MTGHFPAETGRQSYRFRQNHTTRPNFGRSDKLAVSDKGVKLSRSCENRHNPYLDALRFTATIAHGVCFYLTRYGMAPTKRPMDLLKYQSFPEIGAAVRAVTIATVETWLDIAKHSVPTAGALTTDQLRDHLGSVLEGMAKTLESDQPMTLTQLMDQAAVHGDARFGHRYNLSELLTEYILIRPILLENVANHLGRPVDAVESVALNLAIDVTVKQGVLAFENHQSAELMASMESRAKYLSFLSHDLRGGLNGTLLMMEVLRRDLEAHKEFAESLSDLDSMRRAILETVGTMDRFLHAEKLRSGKIQPRFAQVDLQRLIGDLINQFAWQAREQNVDVTAVTPEDGKITSDRELLLMVLHNLLSNAIKYGKGKPVTIKVERLKGDVAARISVSDSGPGIAEADLTTIFSPYARGETHGKDGTGLGLSIARMSANLLDAKLWAESTVGQGSTFYLEIPAVRQTTDRATQK
jgi:signal transduction histidine kinase